MLSDHRPARPGPRGALVRVAKNRRTAGGLKLEPVLGLKLIRPDHPERTRGGS